MNEDNLWVEYEPDPPRCLAIVVHDGNFDEVCQSFSEGFYHDGLVSSTKHVNRREGAQLLTLTFSIPQAIDETYQVTVKVNQVLYRSEETEGRYAVMDYGEFRRTWRKRLSK